MEAPSGQYPTRRRPGFLGGRRGEIFGRGTLFPCSLCPHPWHATSLLHLTALSFSFSLLLNGNCTNSWGRVHWVTGQCPSHQDSAWR